MLRKEVELNIKCKNIFSKYYHQFQEDPTLAAQSGNSGAWLCCAGVRHAERDTIITREDRQPFLLPRQNPVFGKPEAKDSLENDGLLDAYDKVAMGNCAELCAEKHEISRESLDVHAIESYTGKRAERAWKAGRFDAEVVPVVIKGKKSDTV